MDQFDSLVRLRRIGICPVCGKGKMLQGSAGWTCDYFKTLDDKCIFTIFQSYYGYQLREKDAIAIIENGETEILSLTNKEGESFSGRLRLIDGKIKAVPVDNKLGVNCPLCGNDIIVTSNGYYCKSYFKKNESHCPVAIPKIICGKKIKQQDIIDSLEKGYSDIIDGLRDNQGRQFSSILRINDKGFTLDGSVATCPKCGGKIYAGAKAYNCSNYRNPSVKCDFTIWRTIGKRSITVEDVSNLCEKGQTNILEFQTQGGTKFERRLFLTDDFHLKYI